MKTGPRQNPHKIHVGGKACLRNLTMFLMRQSKFSAAGLFSFPNLLMIIYEFLISIRHELVDVLYICVGGCLAGSCSATCVMWDGC